MTITTATTLSILTTTAKTTTITTTTKQLCCHTIEIYLFLIFFFYFCHTLPKLEILDMLKILEYRKLGQRVHIPIEVIWSNVQTRVGTPH